MNFQNFLFYVIGNIDMGIVSLGKPIENISDQFKVGSPEIFY